MPSRVFSARLRRAACPRCEPLEVRRLLSAGAIAGAIYNDLNANKTRDAGDTPLGGVEVYVDRNLNGMLDAGEPATLTDAGGTYRFSGLTSSSYVVSQVVPA